MGELSVFEKDPDTQGMLILPPSLKTNGYVHLCGGYCFGRVSNLGSRRGWTHRGERVSRAYVYINVVIGQQTFTTF